MEVDKCYLGDCRSVLAEIAGAGIQVQTCVTSPPYFGLRDYGVAGQLGLEQTPEAYISKMVEVFRAVRDVLADDGTLWLNIGDSYASTAPGTRNSPQAKGSKTESGQWANYRPDLREHGVKPKDLIGIPWLLAFALRADGWYLRQDIIWNKPNPMPESVRDRCTKAHEYLFLFSKSPRYYFDSDAMKEPASDASIARWAQDVDSQRGSDRVPGKTNGTMKAVGGPRSRRNSFKRDGSKRAQTIPGQTAGTHRNDRAESEWDTAVRNRRSVWTVATTPYAGAHFAVMPEALVEPCILAGCRAGDVVLDPFMGSGTVASVAQRLGRRWIGAELNPEYLALQAERTRQAGLILEAAA